VTIFVNTADRKRYINMLKATKNRFRFKALHAIVTGHTFGP
jgi:hypothetical protein